MLKQCHLKQNYTLKLLIPFKMAYSCCFGLRGNLEFLQKSFITLTAGADAMNIFKII